MPMPMRDLLRGTVKTLAPAILGDYSAYRIYARASDDPAPPEPRTATTFRVDRVDEAAIQSSPEPLIREQTGYAGAGSCAYACFDGERIVGVCFYWFGDRYLKRNFWPLSAGEAKLVQIITLPDVRGRGAATALIASSCRDMMLQGFRRTYARIWHSNTPSLRAFERAAWSRIALVIEINPLRRNRPIRIRLGARR